MATEIVEHFPPGPPTDFVGGHLLSMRRDSLGFFTSNMHQYGGLVHLKFRKYDAYQVNDPDLVQQVVTTQHRIWHKSVVYKNTLGDYLGDGLLISDGDFWKRQRRLMQPAFHTKRISAYAETMVENTRHMLDTWQTGEQRDIAHDMMELTLWIVGKTLFDVDLRHEQSMIAEALENLLHDVSTESRRVVPIPEWIPTPLKHRKQHTIELLNKVVMPIITERRKNLHDTGDLLSMLLLAEDEDGSKMSDKHVRDEALTLVLAGHETTANALTWTLYLLSQHPEIEAKLQAEVDNVLGNSAATLDDLKHLTYTEMVLKEGMRLYPPAWSFSRQAIEDTQLGDYHIKAKRMAVIIPYAIHRNEEYFPDPERFDPERFNADNEHTIPRYAYLPFGGGPRICIGNAFAMMEAKLILSAIVQRYQLRLAAGHQVVPEPLLTLRPKYGMAMDVQTRSE